MKRTPDFSDAFLKKLPTGFSEVLIATDTNWKPENESVSFPDSFSERLPDMRSKQKPNLELLNNTAPDLNQNAVIIPVSQPE